MTKRKSEEWNNRETCFMLTYCILCFISGIILLIYFDVLIGLGVILISAIFLIPSLIEAKKKVGSYLKERRAGKLRQIRETFIVGGTPQKHHKKKKQRQPAKCPVINDFISKGTAMRELGLFYEKKSKKVTFAKIAELQIKSSAQSRAYRQLNELFDALKYRKRIRIAHQANIGSGHHGDSIRKMVETEAKRRGVSISVRMKGEDIIIEK